MRLAGIGVAIVGGALLAAADVCAQQRDPAAAEALFREGKAALAEGKLDRACSLFSQSHQIDAAPGTLFHLADCEEKRGRVATAWGLFEEVASKLAESDPRLASVRMRAAALLPKLPKLTVTIAAGAPAGTRVARDGVPIEGPTLGTPLPVDPGAHVVAVAAPDHEERRFDVTLGEAEARSIEVSPGARVALQSPVPPPRATVSPVVTPPPPDARERPGSTQRTVGIVLVGGGAAVATAGSILALVAKGNYDDSADFCSGADRCTAEGVEIRDDARTTGDVATVLFFSGLAIAAGGAVLWISAPSTSSRPGGAGLWVGPASVSARAVW